MTPIQKLLLKWYASHARDLPWRRTKDPYAIWVSEIMLQQTQVAAVIPYYEKWMKRFPTVRSLAKAPSSEVLKYWAGLGYYRRVRMLHEGAKNLMGSDPKGSDPSRRPKLPRRVNDLMKISGIGRYTAGAIASIAFDERAPVLDGNVIRVLTRLDAIPSDIQSPKTLEKLWALAESLLPERKTGDFNQAMMELGATVCLPRNPRCLICPVKESCKALASGNPERFPVKKRKEKLLKDYSCALILRKNGRVLLQKQPEEGRWGGLWMFPWWKKKSEMMRQIQFDVGARHAVPLHRQTIYHGFTKYRVKLEVYECTDPSRVLSRETSRPSSPPNSIGGSGPYGSPVSRATRAKASKNFQWVPIRNLKKFAFPSPHKKIAEQVVNG